MVAGSQIREAVQNSAGGILGGSARLSGRATAASWQRIGVAPLLLALYGIALVALLSPFPFGQLPAWAYNWEGYTAWRWSTFWEDPAQRTLAIWAPSDGLMTDSGQGPLLGLPLSLSIALGGYNLDAMRLPTMLLAALAVPLLWLCGRRMVGNGPAVLAALLLALSPAFLFYGRTATLVGVSLVPLLLTVLALARVLDAGSDMRWRWLREGALVASMLLGIFAYAPVRLLWPLSLLVLACAALISPARRGALLLTMLLCALAVPLTLMGLQVITQPQPEPVAAAAGYFHARGEQLVAMREDPSEARDFVRTPEDTARSGRDAAVVLVRQNAADLGRLLLDRGANPVLTDYWNETGRFWPWFFLPFAAAGACLVAVRGARGWLPRALPLLLTLGLALPLLLTTRVHIGRLLPALPFALLLVAAGAWVCGEGLAALVQRLGGGAARWATPLLAGALLLPAAAGARADLTVPLDPPREEQSVVAMTTWLEQARERGGAVLVEDPNLGDDIERVHAATYRLGLDPYFRLVDLAQSGAADSGDDRPPLYWHGALGALQAGTIAQPCQRLWFVAPEISTAFYAAWQQAGCTGAPDSVILP